MAVKRRKRITLNVSGHIFETYQATIDRFPNTLLGNKNERKPFYCNKTGHHFFDRNRACFESILYYYQSCGILRCPKDMPITIFEEECKYFQIPQDEIDDLKRKEGIIFDDDDEQEENPTLRHHIWNVLEHPDSSRFAWVFAILSQTVVWISIISASIETLHIPGSEPKGTIKYGDYWSLSELILNGWFMVEVLVRILFTTNISAFFKKGMNWVDILAVAPYFVLLMFKTNKTGILGILKTLKFLRVLKLFRLSKHSRRIKVVGSILASSLPDLQVLMMCFILIVFFGGSVMYMCERDRNRDVFSSIPHSIWWAVQSITTVGYGDMIPISPMGKVFAVSYMLFGVLTISLPVLTIVCLFTDIYPKNIECEESMKQQLA